MDDIGMNVQAKESHIRILGEAGELRERRIRTTSERFAAAVLGYGPRARVPYTELMVREYQGLVLR